MPPRQHNSTHQATQTIGQSTRPGRRCYHHGDFPDLDLPDWNLSRFTRPLLQVTRGFRDINVQFQLNFGRQETSVLSPGQWSLLDWHRTSTYESAGSRLLTSCLLQAVVVDYDWPCDLVGDDAHGNEPYYSNKSLQDVTIQLPLAQHTDNFHNPSRLR